jgi:hemolysin III
MYAKLRDPISGLTHFAGIIGALTGLVVLLVLSDRHLPTLISLVVYGASLVLMFTASTVYHSVRAAPGVIHVLRKIDHAAIYVLIAGTYTPFCINAFEGFWRWGFLSIIWGLALVGILVKVFFMRAPRWITAGVYVIMGWLCMFAIQEMLASLTTGTIAWLATGGIVYTLGAVIYITRKLDFKPGVFGFHEVWHLFVLLGAATHFIAVFNLIRTL